MATMRNGTCSNSLSHAHVSALSDSNTAYRKLVTDSCERREGLPPWRGLGWDLPSTGFTKNHTPSGAPGGMYCAGCRSRSQTCCPCDSNSVNSTTFSPGSYNAARQSALEQYWGATGERDSMDAAGSEHEILAVIVVSFSGAKVGKRRQRFGALEGRPRRLADLPAVDLWPPATYARARCICSLTLSSLTTSPA